jgi:hypothetical protein
MKFGAEFDIVSRLSIIARLSFGKGRTNMLPSNLQPLMHLLILLESIISRDFRADDQTLQTLGGLGIGL